MNTATKRLVPLCSALLVAGQANAALYIEKFDRNVPGGFSAAATSSIGWNAYVGPSATNLSNIVPGANDRAGISNLAGNPTADGLGYLYAANDGESGTADQIWALFDQTAVSITNPTEISFRMGATNTAATARILIRIGTDWFASASTGFSSAAFASASDFSIGNDADTLRSLTYSTDAANWLSVNFTPGSALSLGSTPTSDLSSDPITAIGFFVSSGGQGSGGIRFDSLTVTPEPSTALLIGLGFLRLLHRRRI